MARLAPKWLDSQSEMARHVASGQIDFFMAKGPQIWLDLAMKWLSCRPWNEYFPAFPFPFVGIAENFWTGVAFL